MCQIDGLISLDVDIGCMHECLSLFVLCQNVMCDCTVLSAVFDRICALQVFIIISFRFTPDRKLLCRLVLSWLELRQDQARNEVE